MRQRVVFVALLTALAGCPVTQPLNTPVPALRLREPATGRRYWIYVPSYYDEQREWPLVITLHGTHGWDGSMRQVMEWKALAEAHGLIVAAPDLKSVQGILPLVRKLWHKDLEADERAVLALLDHLTGNYRIDRNYVLLTGFSAGGYPLYYIGLRNPAKFNMLIARACNSDLQLLEEVKLTDQVRKLPICIFWGKDDLKPLQDQSWQAFRWLREHRCSAEQDKTQGGHRRDPGFAYKLWH